MGSKTIKLVSIDKWFTTKWNMMHYVNMSVWVLSRGGLGPFIFMIL
ncbi:MAG: hypothetical protein PWP27_2588 [Clostridiales bacterium]|nr:hypothetical protein [Clostridiales bacterium]